MAPKYYFTTRGLLTIAILASLGGAMSMGYLANVTNRLMGVPYGAGQVVAGLLLWLILILALTDKKASGSHLGLFVAFFSLVEGIFTEIGFWPFKKYRGLSYMAGWAMRAFAYVALSLLSIFSGAAFAGIVRREIKQKKASRLTMARALAVLFVLAIAFSVYYSLVRLKGDPLQFTVMGDVAYTKDCCLPAYSLPAYIGVPLIAVLKDEDVKGGAANITISASDGYMQAFELSNVTASDDAILINDNDTVRVVAKGYPGGKWVEMVTSIEVT